VVYGSVHWSDQLTTRPAIANVSCMNNLRPVQRRSVPDEVAEQLVDGIVAGELPAGDPLPSERDLAERLGVSRPTVRAALTRLASAGLVETRQGGGSTVRDYMRHAGLDLLPRLLSGRGGVDLRVVRDVARTRSVLGGQVARLAAGTPGDDAPLREAVAAIAEVIDDPVARELAAVAFWDTVVDRSGSIVFRLLYNQLRAAYEPAVELLADVLAVESTRLDLYAALVDQIVAGDQEAAGEAADVLLRLGSAAIAALLDPMLPASTPDSDPPARSLS
jgi:GntR family transcriptional repressor for pyruvate dehydrogenase complex